MTKKHINIILAPILIFLLILVFWPRSSSLSAILTLDQAYSTTDNTSLSASFSSSVSSKDQKKIKIKSDPSLSWQISWSSDSNAVFKPQSDLQPNTSYAADLTHKGQSIASLIFTTTQYNNKQFIEVAKQQTEDDYNTAQAFDDLHKKYPWYSYIPIKDPNFIISYSFESESFKIHLLQSTPEIKQQALRALQEIGIDLDQYDHYFIEPNDNFQQLLSQ